MKLKRQRRFEAEVSTSSLNDIMFFLLLFFLIISTLGNPNVIKLLLPKSSKSTHDVSKQPISLTITKDKVYYINSTPIPFPQLEERLLAAVQGMEEPTVVLRAESSLTVQDLVDAMSLGAKLKIRMVLATELNK
ncbi:Tol-Pal system protein TolR [Emticicia aquatica]|jgi:biopolymer transport protein ExbD|uniref:Tol-Pal system protein TolR n=1 Tax=Emticicia aquatica TaxID=1681835 RepID=A0ABM9ANQ6_9BACT|nr:biopolymer transporter ExbD [Emticicia aquatica]CAH0994881.1 Tol-Pal system protein TolR [Emticicia aquatica]